MDWPKFEECLASYYPDLRDLTFCYFLDTDFSDSDRLAEVDEGDVTEYLQERLPRLHAEGILRIAEPTPVRAFHLLVGMALMAFSESSVNPLGVRDNVQLL